MSYHNSLVQLLLEQDADWGRDLIASAAQSSGFRLAAEIAPLDPLWRELPCTAIGQMVRGLGFGDIEGLTPLEEGSATRFRSIQSTLSLRPLFDGAQPVASCATLGGLVAGALASLEGRPPSRVSVNERVCVSEGAPHCEFEIRCVPPAGGAAPLPPTRCSDLVTLPDEKGPAQTLRARLLPLEFAPRSAGGLGDYGDDLLLLPAGFYAALASAWLHRTRQTIGTEQAWQRLEQTARRASRHLFDGLQATPTWRRLVLPRLAERGDPKQRARAAMTLLSGFGWGHWQAGMDLKELQVHHGLDGVVDARSARRGPSCHFTRGAYLALLQSFAVLGDEERWHCREDRRCGSRSFCSFQATHEVEQEDRAPA